MPLIPPASSRSAIRRFAGRHATVLWISFFAICIGLFAYHERDQFASAISAMARSHPIWLSVLIGTQLAALAVTARTYQVLLTRMGHKLRLGRLALLHLQRKVVGTITPAGGPASVYVFVRGLGGHGVSSEDALFTTGLRSLTGFSAFVALLLPITLVGDPSNLTRGVGAVALVGFVLVMAGVVALLSGKGVDGRIERHVPERLTRLLTRARSHGIGPRDLAGPFALSLTGHVVSIATLYVALVAVGHTPSLVAVLTAYTVGTVFTTLAPVFQGIGVVEVTTAVTLERFGVPAGLAVAATLLFRGATVWFPLLIGLAVEAVSRINRSRRLRTAQSKPAGQSRGLLPGSPVIPAETPALSPARPLALRPLLSRRRGFGLAAAFAGLLLLIPASAPVVSGDGFDPMTIATIISEALA